MPEQPHVVWQLCHLTAGGIDEQWQYVWQNAFMVTSYLFLPLNNYLRLPFGYDPSIFNANNRAFPPSYDIVTFGYIDEDEGGEVISRLLNYFPKVIHIGKNLNLGGNYYHAENVSDTQLAQIYRTSKFVAGMRLVEGFELPIIEGAACGCIPITFNLECYAHWFDQLAFLVNLQHIDQDLSFKSNILTTIEMCQS